MNAILLCGANEKLEGVAGDHPVCLMPLAGFPLLGYILAGLARLCVTRIVMTVGASPGRIKEYTRFHLPDSMVRMARCPRDVPADSLSSLAAAMRLTEYTGLLIVTGNCIFGTDLAGRTANAETGILPYLVRERYSQDDTLINLENERIRAIGSGVAAPLAGGRAISLSYVPRGYLGALRGIIVELTAAGAAKAPYYEALRVLIERGYAFNGFDAEGSLYAEIKEPRDLPFAIKIALELQRREDMDRQAREAAGRNANSATAGRVLSRIL